MRAKRPYRDRDDAEVAVLDALVERGAEGMTVLELRAAADADIEAIERALPALKREGLIDVETDGGTTRIRPDDRVVATSEDGHDDPSFLEWLRDQLPF